jgi:hypothetical protein
MMADQAKIFRDLRKQALSVRASDLGLEPGESQLWGVLMETGFPEAVVTLASFAEGTTSLYFSTGGGTIGAGEHASVRAAAERFLAAADENLGQFSPTREYPLPSEGRVRFYVHTFHGLLTADRDEQDLGYQRDPLAPVFHAGHGVITAIRELDESS